MANSDTPHSSVRILVVDDFEPWRQQVCSILQIRPGLRVVAEIADGLEAVQEAKELQPDLVLLDIGLPNLNGLEAANRIRQVAPSAKILFLTQNNDKDIVRAALSSGAQGYVLKTDAGSELLPAVAGVLGGDDFVSSGIKGGDSGKTLDAPPTLNENTQSPVAT
jgi:two-component system nitrate/nitrite response regulator NarL